MPHAKSLEDLLRIRNANRDYLDSIASNLGTALGFKKKTGEPVSNEPAILIFVPRKIAPKWLRPEQRIKKTLVGPGNLTCPLDVVEGSKYEETFLHVVQGRDEEIMPFSFLQESDPLSKDQLRVRELLHGWTEKIAPGAQIASVDSESSREQTGAIGFFALDRTHGGTGFVTNEHIAGQVGNKLWFPRLNNTLCGTVARTHKFALMKDRFKDLIDDPNGMCKVDCAFADLNQDLSKEQDIDPRLPLSFAGGKVKMKKIGDPLPLDLNSMGFLGKKVLSVGPQRATQRGQIYGFAYKYKDKSAQSFFTDHLIVGNNDSAFSSRGDSGKLIVTDDEDLRPVALLWGGEKAQLRSEHQQEKWSYATDINYVLELLNIDVINQF